MKTLSTLLIIVVLSLSVLGQSKKYEKVGSVTDPETKIEYTFGVDIKSVSFKGVEVTFEGIMVADKGNFSLTIFNANCTTHDFAILSYQRTVEGKEQKRVVPEKLVQRKAEKNTAVYLVIEYVCKNKNVYQTA